MQLSRVMCLIASLGLSGGGVLGTSLAVASLTLALPAQAQAQSQFVADTTPTGVDLPLPASSPAAPSQDAAHNPNSATDVTHNPKSATDVATTNANASSSTKLAVQPAQPRLTQVDAANVVRQLGRGQVMAVHPRIIQDKTHYAVKVLDAGRMRTILIDGDTGALR